MNEFFYAVALKLYCIICFKFVTFVKLMQAFLKYHFFVTDFFFSSLGREGSTRSVIFIQPNKTGDRFNIKKCQVRVHPQRFNFQKAGENDFFNKISERREVRVSRQSRLIRLNSIRWRCRTTGPLATDKASPPPLRAQPAYGINCTG